MRGEYTRTQSRQVNSPELPPRARRILDRKDDAEREKGTTSACAENTARDSNAMPRSWNYLRVRGEYGLVPKIGISRWELPPRARRILEFANINLFLRGTTSACAENTAETCTNISAIRNYLRVRGEYDCRQLLIIRLVELPPRARRIHLPNFANSGAYGTTSACAENTRFYVAGRGSKRNYLRVRGEYPK